MMFTPFFWRYLRRLASKVVLEAFFTPEYALFEVFWALWIAL
jgi:hypothetical protein